MRKIIVSTKNIIIALVTALLCLLSGCNQEQEPAFSPVDANSEHPFEVLKGYMKRRNMALEKSATEVLATAEGYIFRWHSTDGARYFQVQQKNTAWLVVEIDNPQAVLSAPETH